jgi:hypothetical protein
MQLPLSFGCALHPGTVTFDLTHGNKFAVGDVEFGSAVRISPFELEKPIALQSVPPKDASQLKQLFIGVSVFTGTTK